MHWMIKCRSKPDTRELREATLDAHRNFLDGWRAQTWFSGPIFDDDNINPLGSLRFIELPDRAAAQAYIDADPYTTADIFAEIIVQAWSPAVDTRQLTYARKDGTMQFILHAIDVPDSDALRAPLRLAHRDYLNEHADVLPARGPLKTDDGQTIIGSACILDVADRAAAEALWANEPFNKAGVYENVTIERWRFGHV